MAWVPSVSRSMALPRSWRGAPRRTDARRGQPGAASVQGCLFASLLDGSVHLLAGLLHHLLDAGGVYAAVGEELGEGDAGDLSAYRVEAGEGGGVGGVVDDDVHAGDVLQGADVAALPADDTA